MKEYTNNFYEYQRERSRISAGEVVPLVMELVRPTSVVDVGCGSGAWLSVFREHAVDDIAGLDGDWVDQAMLFIPPDRFTRTDLKQPFSLDRQFDLAISLEVAEHIPAERAGAFIDSLTALAPVVLFSAAIPGQGGTHHVNEQWQEYWARLFQERGFAVIDCIRRRVWQNENVEWWYAQNILMFARQDQLDRYPLLLRERDHTYPSQLCLVHPKQYLAARDPENTGLRSVVSALKDGVKALTPRGHKPGVDG